MPEAKLAGEPFPLYWPEGTPRAASRRRSAYKVRSIVDPFDKIRRRLGGMKASSVVISSNLPLRRDGLPVAGESAQIKDPGVAVYFTRRGRDLCIACDAWLSVAENLRAIQNTLDALALIERSGSSSLADAAFAGFARLPAQAGPSVNHWSVVLGITGEVLDLAPAQRAIVLARCEASYRELVRMVHPDRGGSNAAMVELNRAMEEARRDLKGA